VAANWSTVAADLHQIYGIDVDSPEIEYGRSWGWLRTRIAGLMTTRSRTLWRLIPPADRDKMIKAMAHGAEVTPWI
jgi:hypothetical protein